MNDMTAVGHEQEIPDIFKAMIGVHQVIDAQGLEPALRHLVHLRASQINRCAFCVKMHIREAREDGETNDRLDRVVVWDAVGDFSEKEQAALAWTETLTALDAKTDYGALRARLRRHFSEQEIDALTATIAMVNAWNHINSARH